MKKIVLLLSIFDLSYARKPAILVFDAPAHERVLLKNYKKNYRFFFYDIVNNPSNKPYGNENLPHELEIIAKRYPQGSIDGVFSSRDYIGNLASVLTADAYGLPGPSITSALTCHHKYLSRVAQRKIVPNSTPHFGLINPRGLEQSLSELSVKFPLFVKPIKAYFSFGAEKIASRQELMQKSLELLPSQEFLKPLQDLIDTYLPDAPSVHQLLAEEVLEGKQVTIEGFMNNGECILLGVVDSIMYPGTISFSRFEYPSAISKLVQERMAKVAKDFLQSIGFDNSFFNIEMMYNPEKNSIHIIEINPRMACQFSDLYEKVDGRNSYDYALALATGNVMPPVIKAQGPFKASASFVLRVFENAHVKRSPTKRELARIKKLNSDARIEVHVSKGSLLSDELQDGKSFVYATVNIGADSKQALQQKFERIKESLRFEFEKI